MENNNKLFRTIDKRTVYTFCFGLVLGAIIFAAGDAVINYESSWDSLMEGYEAGQNANPL